MRLDRERDRGNVDESTDIVNEGDYLAYAEADYGPWTIEFERESSGFNYVRDDPERVTVKGPFIGAADGDLLDGDADGEVVVETTVGVWSTITEAIDTWDYVELADEEAHTPDE
jgi:hypothetical protein